MSKYYLIVNPHGGGKKGRSVLEKAQPIFRKAGDELEIKETRFAGHARILANTLDFEGYDGLVAIGGDGTMHEIVNGMLLREDGKKHSYFIRSDQEFADELFVSRNTVRKARARLERLEVINTEDRAIGGTHKRWYFLREGHKQQFKNWVVFVEWLKREYGYKLPATRNSKQFEAVFDLFTWIIELQDGGSDSEGKQWVKHLHALYANNWTAQS